MKVVWVVLPAKDRIIVFSADGDVEILGPGDTLTCEDLLPGFALSVDAVFRAA